MPAYLDTDIWSALELATGHKPKTHTETMLLVMTSRMVLVPPIPDLKLAMPMETRRDPTLLLILTDEPDESTTSLTEWIPSHRQDNEPWNRRSAPAAALIASPYAGPVAPVVNHVAPAAPAVVGHAASYVAPLAVAAPVAYGAALGHGAYGLGHAAALGHGAYGLGHGAYGLGHAGVLGQELMVSERTGVWHGVYGLGQGFLHH
ncbi:hypothetical protein HNY73_009289 [Argiope bruennichi]|uniref:Uncharacterized protein n=1 Tax=Argiope bruennichi TaxID=94029 RepID=A0A8T0FA22_ARGBR|nr:hypothetical protein HNY73_009289 [Argiope bruennichi]